MTSHKGIDKDHLLDHILIGNHSLIPSLEGVKSTTGIDLGISGEHPQWNTCNAICALPSNSYIEWIAPIEKKSALAPFDVLHGFDHPTCFTWAVRTKNIQHTTNLLSAAGIQHGKLIDGARQKVDGSWLRWKMVFPSNTYNGILPFFIEWDQESLHPAQASPHLAEVTHFELLHPQPQRINQLFDLLHIDHCCYDHTIPQIKLIIKLNQQSMSF